jgi:hypothetical protein
VKGLGQPAAIAGILAGVVALAGCTPAIPTDAPSSPSASAARSAAASPSTGATSRPSAGAVTVEPSLLDVLPDEIEGQPFRPDAETAADIAVNGNLGPDIEAIALALYIQPGSDNLDNPDDLAIVSIVRPRPGVFGDGWFRSWRSTYDVGACDIAGGVEPGSAVTEIGAHETHIGSCQGGVHTYHVHLPNPDRVVSITAAGEGRFGERVVAGLTE